MRAVIHRICVFCGSNSGGDAVYAESARNLGKLFAREGIGLVYGGGSVGLMGELADSVLAAGCEVTGVIPHALWAREVGHPRLTDLRIVETMHGHAAHRAIDLLTNDVLRGLGYGEGIDIFENAVAHWHDADNIYPHSGPCPDCEREAEARAAA